MTETTSRGCRGAPDDSNEAVGHEVVRLIQNICATPAKCTQPLAILPSPTFRWTLLDLSFPHRHAMRAIVGRPAARQSLTDLGSTSMPPSNSLLRRPGVATTTWQRLHVNPWTAFYPREVLNHRVLPILVLNHHRIIATDPEGQRGWAYMSSHIILLLISP